MDNTIQGLSAYGGDFQDKLITALYLALALEAQGISVMPNLKSKTTLHKLMIRKGLKPYTGTFKAKSDIVFEPRELAVEKVQRDMQIHPSEFLQTFLEKKRGAGENSKNMTVPFAEVVWQSVMDQIANEIVTDTMYNGVGKAGFAAYNAATAYPVNSHLKYTQDGEVRYFRTIAAVAAGENPDNHPEKYEWAGGRALTVGFNKIIKDEEAAGKIVPVSTGEITSADAYGQYTEVWRKLPEQIRMKGGTILCSQNSYESLMDDVENKVKKNFEEVNGITYLSKTDKKAALKPVSWLTNTSRLIATPNGNLWMGTDQTSDMNVIKTIEQMYHLEAGITFMIGFQIADLEVLVTNDQD
jgi:hypothetical protein